MNEPIEWLPHVEDKMRGLKYIVPVALEGYDRGYNPMVQDEYIPGMRVDGDDVFGIWVFSRRVRTFTRPLHYTYTGKPYRCETCEMWWQQYPERPDEVLIDRGYSNEG